jgi:hypothetical protein
MPPRRKPLWPYYLYSTNHLVTFLDFDSAIQYMPPLQSAGKHHAITIRGGNDMSPHEKCSALRLNISIPRASTLGYFRTRRIHRANGALVSKFLTGLLGFDMILHRSELHPMGKIVHFTTFISVGVVANSIRLRKAELPASHYCSSGKLAWGGPLVVLFKSDRRATRHAWAAQHSGTESFDLWSLIRK